MHTSDGFLLFVDGITYGGNQPKKYVGFGHELANPGGVASARPESVASRDLNEQTA